MPTNDLVLVRDVLERAEGFGYVLIGEHQQVWRRRVRGGPHVDRAPVVEANAVHQLLDRGFLALGAVRPVRHGRHETAATSVLLTATARARLRRWHIHPPEVTTNPTAYRTHH